MDVHKLADAIGMEWKRVPCMPVGYMYDNAWRNILERQREAHGAEKVSAALELIKNGMFNGTVPHEDVS